jgi:predicted dehydrogenase
MSANDAAVRIGVVGLGAFGAQHLAAWQAVSSARVVALCDTQPEALEAAGALFPSAAHYEELGALLADPAVEAVDLVTPADRHLDHALAALGAGKHVFVEKPMAETADEAQRVVDAARAGGRRLQVGLVSRFGVPYALLHDQVLAGAFGDLVLLRLKRNIPSAWAPAFQHTHPIFETAIHDLDLLVWYARSRCRSVYAQERSHLGLRFPDAVVALLSFESGLLAEVETTWHVPAGAPRGILGAWEVGGLIDAELELIGTRQTARYSLARPGLELWNAQASLAPELSLFPQVHGQSAGAMREQLAHFAATVRRGQDSSIAPAADSVAAIRIAEAIVRSAATSSVVRL